MIPLSVETANLVYMLRLRREELGLTQEQIGGQIGRDQQALSRWEQGLEAPTLGSLIRWARALDCTIEVRPR